MRHPNAFIQTWTIRLGVAASLAAAGAVAVPAHANQVTLFPISLTGEPTSTIKYNPYPSTPGILEAFVTTYDLNSPLFDPEFAEATLNAPILGLLPAGEPVAIGVDFSDSSGAAMSTGGGGYVQQMSGFGSLSILDLATKSNILKADISAGAITGLVGANSATITLDLINPTSSYIPIILPGVGGPIQLTLTGVTANVALSSNAFCVASLPCTTPFFAGFNLDWSAAITQGSDSTPPGSPGPQPVSVPEPASIALFGVALASLAAVRARGRR